MLRFSCSHDADKSSVILTELLIQEEHLKAVKFNEVRERFRWCLRNDKMLFRYRVMVLVPMMMVLIKILAQDWKSTVTYEGQWAFMCSTLSVLFVLLAQSSIWFHSAAVYIFGYSASFNIIVFGMFLCLNSQQMMKLDPEWEYFVSGSLTEENTYLTVCELIFIHTVPIINCVLELTLTNIVL